MSLESSILDKKDVASHMANGGGEEEEIRSDVRMLLNDDTDPTSAPTLSWFYNNNNNNNGTASSSLSDDEDATNSSSNSLFPPGVFDPTSEGWGQQQQQQRHPQLHPPSGLSPSSPPPPPQEQNMVVVSILIVLIAILCLILAFVTIPPLLHWIRRKLPVPQIRIDRRYATIDGWLITKRVQPHDDVCNCIRNRYCREVSRTATDTVPGITTTTTCIDAAPVPAVSSSPHPRADLTTTTTTMTIKAKLKYQSKAQTFLSAAILLEKLAPAAAGPTNEGQAKAPSVVNDAKNARPTEGSKNICGDDIPSEEKTTTAAAADVENQLLVEEDADADDADDDVDSIDKPGCAICLEAFSVGDKVSWSTDAGCGHVFHHSCIREWLLRRVACPCCRKVVLPVDRPLLPKADLSTATRTTPRTTTIPSNGVDASTSSSSSASSSSHARKRVSNELLNTYAKERATRTTTSYYCIDDGLITLHGFGLIHHQRSRQQRGGTTKRGSHDDDGEDRTKTAAASSIKPGRDDQQSSTTTTRNMSRRPWLTSAGISALPSILLQRYRMRRSGTQGISSLSTSSSSSATLAARDEIPASSSSSSPGRTFLQEDSMSIGSKGEGVEVEVDLEENLPLPHIEAEQQHGGSSARRRSDSEGSIEMVFERDDGNDDEDDDCPAMYEDEDDDDYDSNYPPVELSTTSTTTSTMRGLQWAMSRLSTTASSSVDPIMIMTMADDGTSDETRMGLPPPVVVTAEDLIAELSAILALESSSSLR